MGRSLKLGENRGNAASVATGARARRVLNQHHPADKRARLFAERAFAVGGPEIMRRADRFFGPVVEVVAEGRADLALQLDGGDQFALVMTKDPRAWSDGNSRAASAPRAPLDCGVGQAVGSDRSITRAMKPSMFLPAGHAGALALIGLPGLDLFLSRASRGCPRRP